MSELFWSAFVEKYKDRTVESLRRYYKEFLDHKSFAQEAIPKRRYNIPQIKIDKGLTKDSLIKTLTDIGLKPDEVLIRVFSSKFLNNAIQHGTDSYDEGAPLTHSGGLS